ncbi:hypothetical protein SEPCBS57363_002684 [Sporothrix epigloea]|uniref:SWI5-dependent HO expression protein 3 n=1 Tax=Sporothrix epigloea TaxID=1892477 RepID=A0ABP0DHB0_9PEZI
MVAKLSKLQEQIRILEAERNEKETQISSLEESYKERTKALICASDKFAADLLQLTSTFNQREEEYRRAVDCASDLATKEYKRTADENKQEIQRELQQERLRRQTLEKELRQAKQDLFVMEENSRRGEQAHEALEKKLAVAELGSKAVTAHLEEKARVLELSLDRDTTIITQLRAALSDKEMDYVNLRSSMEAYDEKIHVLIEHLRGWAQDYTHIGAIRSRLEVLGQIDQSCVATARIREAEQIDIVLAQLRQYCSRQLERDRHFGFSPGQLKASPLIYASDDGHEQRVSDLSAFLDAEVAACQPAISRGEEFWSRNLRDIMPSTASSVRVAAIDGSWEASPATKSHQFVEDGATDVPRYSEASKLNPSSPSRISSGIAPKRTRREARAAAAQKAAMRNPVSPTRTTRRLKRRRPDKGPGREDTHRMTQRAFDRQGSRSLAASSSNTIMSSSPQVLFKMEDSGKIEIALNGGNV